MLQNGDFSNDDVTDEDLAVLSKDLGYSIFPINKVTYDYYPPVIRSRVTRTMSFEDFKKDSPLSDVYIRYGGLTWLYITDPDFVAAIKWNGYLDIQAICYIEDERGTRSYHLMGEPTYFYDENTESIIAGVQMPISIESTVIDLCMSTFNEEVL